MLKKTKISGVKILSEEWHSNRLAKFTSSTIFKLMGTGYKRMIREKVGEELTGKSANTEIETDAMRWGSFFEAEAIEKFGKQMGLSFLVVQQLVCDPQSRFGCTPDGLIVTRESPDKTEYEVETVEVKCPPTFANYIELFECEKPEHLKEANPQYYWQVLDQMDNCESLAAYFVAYHPDFKRGNIKILRIEANHSVIEKSQKIFPIYNDLKRLREKKREAELEFDKIRTKLMLNEYV